MTIITASKGKIHGIMVDGYIPNDNNLENLIYKLNDSESITNYEKYKLLRKIPFINNNSRFYLFYKLVYYARPGPRQTGLNEGLNCVDLA